ncbi:hypothetical protein LguiB_000547 [Lonicera macranthoides]
MESVEQEDLQLLQNVRKWELLVKKLRIGVPVNRGFSDLVNLRLDETNATMSLGVGMVARIGNKNMRIFLKPLDVDLWITIIGFLIVIEFVIWVIEHPINKEFQGSPAQQVRITLWFSFSTLVFAHSKTSMLIRLASNDFIEYHNNNLLRGAIVRNLNFKDGQA